MLIGRIMIGLAALLSVVASASGIVIAIFCTQNELDATRDGVIGTAFALLFVVLTRSYGMKVYDAARKLDTLTAKPPAGYTVDDVVGMVQTLRSAIIVDAEEVKKLNWWMIVTTVVAAVAVGFGDKIAKHFLQK